ncbi:MAG: hypothetical protein JNK37_10255 [Verrucomicrobiales bacterium]|nr:hypothetical protein [Verrucomicrobiales bacterium]
MKTRESFPSGFLIALLAAVASWPAGAAPRIGYVYPAGGQIGTDFEVAIGGQGLDDPLGVVVSGGGVQAEIIEHDKMPSAQVADDWRDKLRELQPQFRKPSSTGELPPIGKVREILYAVELDEKKLRLLEEYDRRRNDPKRQLNSQIGEAVRVRISVGESAEPGLRHVRLLSANGISNPMRFTIGQHPEAKEPEPWTFDLMAYLDIEPKSVMSRHAGPMEIALPATVNGRILPGEVDEFAFHAKKDQQIVVSLQARYLIPYLADAVPGWFQAVVSLHAPNGQEMAFADDYRFDPDPVLFYRIPSDGEYRIRVRDSIYRGREDFVYRVTVGELPFLTGIVPLGAQAGTEVDLVFSGGNLADQKVRRFPVPDLPGMLPLSALGPAGRSNAIAFHVDNVPEDREREPNNRIGAANDVAVPGIVNGTIGLPGDMDFYRIKGNGNQPMTFEIFARRLGSPVDANITVFDDDGNIIAHNDDFENPTAGLTTHHADARVSVRIPSNGRCLVRVADTQHRYGFSNAYRLKFAQGSPGFALRVVPASLNARPGGSARLTIHASRLDGFQGPIAIDLKDAPAGFGLVNATIPAGEDKIEVSLTATAEPISAPVRLVVRGTGDPDVGAPIVIEAVPSEDMMQAFIYRHLVPVDDLLVDVRTPPEKPTPR